MFAKEQAIKKIFYIVWSTLFLLLFSFPAFSIQNQPGGLAEIYKQLGISQNISYTADMTLESSPVQSPFRNAKIFFKNGHTRLEGMQETVAFITIIRQDGIMYSHNSQTNTWIQLNMGNMMEQQNIPPYTKAGDETIDGKPCIKYETAYPAMQSTSTIWIHEGILCRNEVHMGAGTTIISYSNVIKQPLDDSLFMPPANAPVQDMSALMAQFGSAEE